MIVYRIERHKYLKDALSGIGASLSEGARWNSFGTKLVYTAESRALAMLEVTVHLDLTSELPNDRLFVEIEIPDELAIVSLNKSQLPKNWNSKPPIHFSQIVGDNFVKMQQFPVLKVPSAIVEEEFNYLINPDHHDAQKIKIISSKPFNFDSRISN